MAQLIYQTGIPHLSAEWEQFLMNALDNYGMPSMTISSTYRDSQAQAKAMYNNIVTHGVDAEKQLYKASWHPVIDTASDQINAQASPADTISAMMNTMSQLGLEGPHTRQAHNPDFICFDVSPSSVSAEEQQTFEDCMNSIASKFLTPGQYKGESAYHVEVMRGLTKVLKTAEKSSPIATLLLAGAAGWFIAKHYHWI